MASPTNVSLPSIHEMFPAHLMRRDKLDARYLHAPTTSPTRLPPHPHPHTDTVAQHALCGATRNLYGAQIMSPVLALRHPLARLRAHQNPLPPHESGSVPSGHDTHPQHPHALPDLHPRDERERQRWYSEACAPPLPSAHHQQHQPPMDTSDLHMDDDSASASEGKFALPARAKSMHTHPRVSAHLAHHGTSQVHAEGPAPRTHAQGVLVPFVKKHVCSTCFRRFNRPSSLRIHANTHTGATPFRCPWPNCGREFNVNSNMRRHYRNHTAPSSSSSSSTTPPALATAPQNNSPLGPLSTHITIPPSFRGSSGDPSMSVSMQIPGGYMQLDDGRQKRRRTEEESERAGRPGGVGEKTREKARQTHNPNRSQQVYIRDRHRGRHSVSDPKPLVPCVSPSPHASLSPSLWPALSALWGPSSQSSRPSRPSSSRSPATSTVSFFPSSDPTSFKDMGTTTKPRYSPFVPSSRGVTDTRVSTLLRPAFCGDTPVSSFWAERTVMVEVGPVR